MLFDLGRREGGLHEGDVGGASPSGGGGAKPGRFAEGRGDGGGGRTVAGLCHSLGASFHFPPIQAIVSELLGTEGCALTFIHRFVFCLIFSKFGLYKDTGSIVINLFILHFPLYLNAVNAALSAP